jgi:DNA (cytosine-5)-methyltransferase 1
MDAGLSPLAAFDRWPAAIEVYAQNIGHHAEVLDLCDVDIAVERIRHLRPDLIAGGPPCQDFSQAGNRCEGERAALTVLFAKTVVAVRPQWFVMENVGRARLSHAFIEARRLFKMAGYGLTETVLDANLYGVPQRRRRFFCIGRLAEADGFMDGKIAARAAAAPLTVREYLGDELGVEHYYRHPRDYSRRGVFSIDEPAPTVRGSSRPVAPGYQRHLRDTAPPSAVKALTSEQRGRLQTFPKDWRWHGTKTDIDQMVGNAVPVELARFIAEAVVRNAVDTLQWQRVAA